MPAETIAPADPREDKDLAYDMAHAEAPHRNEIVERNDAVAEASEAAEEAAREFGERKLPSDPEVEPDPNASEADVIAKANRAGQMESIAHRRNEISLSHADVAAEAVRAQHQQRQEQ